LRNGQKKEAQEFIDKVHHVEYILNIGNVDFQDTDFIEVKRLGMRKQITLFYRIIDTHNLELLRFWNN
jgi:hypothetical protein